MADDSHPAQTKGDPKAAAPMAKRVKKPKAKPGRKRMGTEVFVPVTIKVEPSELATIEMIAKASRRSRSDVMREMVTLGLKQMLETAFAPQAEERPSAIEAAAEPVPASPEAATTDDVAGAASPDAVTVIADATVAANAPDSPAREDADAAPVPELPDDPKLARILSQKGARKIMDYVSRHPRANTSELLAATGVSSSTLRRRIVALQDAGALFNEGTATRPVWRVPGVEHEREDMLTTTQSAVLGLMRRQPPMPTGQISQELGITKTAVTLAYRELADLGLAFKDGGRWRATPQEGGEGAADE